MADTDAQINFDAPAVLRKWPSLNKGRISNATPYFIVEGTLDECIREFTSKPTSQHHFYEIHTAPQGELIPAVLSAEQIIELARLRDFALRRVAAGEPCGGRDRVAPDSP